MRKTSVWILAGCLTLCGCAARQKNVTDLPTGVTLQQVQNWDTAVAQLDKIAQTVSTLRQTVIALNSTTVTDGNGTVTKVIPDGKTYAAILTSIGKIDQAEIDASAFLKAQPQNWNVSTQAKIKNELAIIQQELQTITAQGLPGIKNPNAQASVQQLIVTLGSAAALILSLTAS